jgi:hypothetical protein
MSKKLGVIVPYRNRYEQLQTFKSSITKYLKSKSIDFELIIVEQDDATEFNRGKLLNIGFKEAKKTKCDYVVFHDVDMLPIDVDYSYSDIPIHLASNLKSRNSDFKRITFDEYFGGVTIFPIDTFETINGYSNDYWGWGFEDDDLLYRCVQNDISLNTKEIQSSGVNTAALKFNGNDAYVVSKNVIDFTKKFTIFVSFYPDDLMCDHQKINDIFTVFSIPGYDFRITYNGYRRYCLEIFDDKGNVAYINSDLKPNYKTTIVATVNPTLKMIKMFQDGEIIGTDYYENSLYDYKKEKNFYLGCANPYVKTHEDKTYFRGLINSFAVFNKSLSSSEILEISKNKHFGLTSNFGNYKSSENLITYYDAKFVKDYKLMDLSGNTNDGKINGCEIVGYTYDDIKVVNIPYRRDGKFELLEHEENGYVNGAWKNITTRYNQLKFHNEVEKGYRNTKEDGLSNLQYTQHSRAKVENLTHLVVGI